MNTKSVLRICCLLAASSTHFAFADEPAASKSYVYKTTPQAELSVTAYLPSETKEKRPAIVFFFGGGWTQGRPKQFEPQALHFASRGLVAICADYRVKSRHNVTPDLCVEDAKSALRWVRKNAELLGVDPDKIVGAGGSAGGHLAACAAMCPGFDSKDDPNISCVPNVLVLFNPVLNLTEMRKVEILGDKAEFAKELSPTLHLKKDSPPTILFYGTDDPMLVQGEEFMNRSKELGHHAELFLAEGEAHAFFNKPPWLERTIQRADQFLVSLNYLKPLPSAEPSPK